MRYYRVTVKPDDGVIHPVDGAIAEISSITRDVLVYINALGNGTGILLYRLRGDPETLTARLDGHPGLITSEVVDSQPPTFHLYVHVKSGQPAGKIMAAAQQYALMIIPPIEFTDNDGGLQATVVGTHTMLKQFIETVSEEIRVSIDQAGRYSPTDGTILGSLSDRQREALTTAVEMGYYDIPRRATHKELATEIGCAPSTFDEHLRLAESRVFGSLFGDKPSHESSDYRSDEEHDISEKLSP